MSGIYGLVSSSAASLRPLLGIAKHLEQRGSDSAGLIVHHKNQYEVFYTKFSGAKILKNYANKEASIAIGFNGSVTNPNFNHQPILRNQIAVFHDGIIL